MAESGKCEVKVNVDDIEINVDDIGQGNIVPFNSFDDKHGTPIEDAYDKKENISNMFAAKLAVDSQYLKQSSTISETFQQYQKACVQVISTTENEEERARGSGILYRHSEDRVIVVTAAHVMNGNFGVKIVLEKDYKSTEKRNIVTAKQVTINLQNPDIKFKQGEDVAVIFLNTTDSKYLIDEVKKFPCPSVNSTLGEQASGYFMAVHYAVGDGAYKKVSVGEVTRSSGNHKQLREQVNIDGGPGASGAPLFNFKGDVVAILKSKEKNYDGIRNFIPNVEIEGELHSFDTNASHEQNFFEFNEGVKFNETLSNNRENLSKKKLVAKEEDFDSTVESLTVFDCLGCGDEHRETKKYSRKEKIESDHFPPYDAYKQAIKREDCPSQIKKILDKGSGKRPGENELPAITIPKVIHRKLDTTGSSSESVDYRSVQAEHIASGNANKAIKKNFKNYFKKGLFKRSNYECTDSVFVKLLDKYEEGFTRALEKHKELNIINEENRTNLEDYIRKLISKDKHHGEQLEKEEIIYLHFSENMLSTHKDVATHGIRKRKPRGDKT